MNPKALVEKLVDDYEETLRENCWGLPAIEEEMAPYRALLASGLLPGEQDADEPVRCPECVEAGERSTVTVGPRSSTLMAGWAFFDEEGHFHDHDPNKVTVTFSCSRGHRWVMESRQECPSCPKLPAS